MDCFIPFIENKLDINTPTHFTNPFDYKPHELCKRAATYLQQSLKPKADFTKGKMYGVLVVRNTNGSLGFLAAYSGNDKEQFSSIPFVPQVFDITNQDGFFRRGENELNAINKDIKELKDSETLGTLVKQLRHEQEKAQQTIAEAKHNMAVAKSKRQEKRDGMNNTIDAEVLQQQLIKESQTEKSQFKKLKQLWQERINTIQQNINTYESQIIALKQLRKAKSALLQEQIFNHYLFTNKKGNTKSASEIFRTSSTKVPPAGAGDCAAPKLIQYAFLNNLQLIAMAEFWWGESPKTEVRKHGYYYPACKSKCEPILGHMLQGFTFEKADDIQAKQEIKVVFEDQTILAINKPPGLLSIPGKTELDSVFTRIKANYPNATGPLIVHRLDMATSGLMLIAKTKEAHEHLQKQFLNRTIQKRYTAVLDGLLEGEKGEINLPLRVDIEDRPRQLVCYDNGKPATTKWEVLERTDSQTRVAFLPISGRTHQLRVHAAHALGLNTPIVGDPLYGKRAKRLMLHAESISFKHPDNNQTMRFSSPAEF